MSDTQPTGGATPSGSAPETRTLDEIMMRRDLRASRRRWRVVAGIAIAIAILAFAGRALGTFGDPIDRDHIARISVTGTIMPDRARRESIRALAQMDQVKAVIVDIDSGGGATAGGEELYEGLRAVAETKPVVAVINQTGASAAYMTAIAADRSFTRRLAVVGSIGVLFRHVDASRLLDTIGIDLDKVATGPLKAEPEPDEPMSPAVRRSLQAVVDDGYDWFVDLVAERRGLDRDAVLALADGRVMTGQMAVQEKLIDAIGGEIEALDWLAEERQVPQGLPVLTHYPLPPGPLEAFRIQALAGVAQWLGVRGEDYTALDGLQSVWHPSR
ncbi:signal peptide peptidase SppA [Cucumibacter marinus]|uniref:signal peptide peptidase SppA n=1 Tax=Cucumibacter marinus TaxID=1121252 RepID=UPI00138AEABF|nr:signal peptide peptidase SppA [Cucumibacter marinus]